MSVHPSSQPSPLSQLDPQSQILLTFLVGFQSQESISEDPRKLPVLQFLLCTSRLEPNSEPALLHAHPSPYNLRFTPKAPCQPWILP
ncbi:hypothetical protein ACRRTK_009390 [Alexandromys fortis]